VSQTDTRKLIARYFATLNASDYDAMEGLLHEDVAHDIAQGDRQIGREAFRAYQVQRAAHYDETFQDIEIMVSESGLRAAAELTIDGRYQRTEKGMPEASGQRYALRAGVFFDIDDGRITRATTHYNLNDQVAQLS